MKTQRNEGQKKLKDLEKELKEMEAARNVANEQKKLWET